MASVLCVAIWDQFAFGHPREDGPMPSALQPAAVTAPNRAQDPWWKDMTTAWPCR